MNCAGRNGRGIAPSLDRIQRDGDNAIGRGRRDTTARASRGRLVQRAMPRRARAIYIVFYDITQLYMYVPTWINAK